MSEAIGANAEVGRSWRDVKWTRTRDRHTSSNNGTGSQTSTIPQTPKKSSRLKVKHGVTSVIPSPEASEPQSAKVSNYFNTISGSEKKRSSKFAYKKYSISELADGSLEEPAKALVMQDGPGWKSKSTSSLSNLARRGSWILHSRSPSPGHRRTPSTNVSRPEKAVISKPESPPPKKEQVQPDTTSTTIRRTSLSATNRPLSSIFTRSASSPQISSNLHKAKSIERLPMIAVDSPINVPDVPRLMTPTRRQLFQTISTESTRKKDDLGNIFRNLDQEYSRFISKPSSHRVVVIRSCLLPFLREYANHPSNNTLRVEDFDRRINILNKWWTGLLEMVNGRHGYGISPSDRPAILDALTGIMQRSEWRQTLTSLVSSRQNTPKTTSSPAIDAGGSEFLNETILKNARTMFVQNLLTQMNFAVERMSLRTVAASVVIFCGKAIAYAFFFCPGVADILVRLWSLQQVTLRRVLDEAGVPRNTNLNSTAESVADLFPPHLRHICLKSLPSLNRLLRERPPTQSNLNCINWDGPWIGRWSGRDSDLFFSFTRHYHNLVCETLGEDSTDRERLCAPGAILVYGQLLSILDATIQVHRNPYIPSQAVTFDDILGADTSTVVLGAKSVNTARSMAENRLIMLLREFLSEASSAPPAAKISFAAIFGNLLKAATKRTCVNDGDACFILCDLLEESMVILARFFRNAEDPTAFLDWPFWLDVLKRLGDSNNTMTEIRLYAFIYGLWGCITKDESKKRDLCLNWLLSEEYAYRQFNHWCPMVRAYYQRLLVWRLAKCEGIASDLDLEIYTALLSLLQKIFSQYLHKRSTAEQDRTMIPSSIPASPAPGRRLLIIRDDSVSTPTAVLTTLLTSSADHSTYQRLAAFETLSKLSEGPNLTETAAKKRFTFLRGLNPFGNTTISPDSSNTATPQDSPPSSTHTPADSTGSSTPESRSSRPSTPPSPATNFIPKCSFKFSLEWIDRPYAYHTDRKLYPPRLPPTSQAVVSKEFAEAIILGDAIQYKYEEGPSRYLGIALAEWSILISECAGFAERRRNEGVHPGKEETPILGVETFRKAVG